MAQRYSKRRCLNPVDLDPVKEACYHGLFHLLEERVPEDLLEASILFRVYYRLSEHVTNRSSCPSHSVWDEISAYLSYGTVSKEED